MRRDPRKQGSRRLGAAIFLLLIAFLSIYLANIKIPIGFVEEPRYTASLYRSLNISVERITFNVAYPGVNGSTISIKLLVGGVRTSIDNLTFAPGQEIRPGRAYTIVNLSGQGPWNIYVYDDHLGKDLLAGVIYRSTDLIVQTGMYTALVIATLITDLELEISQARGVGIKLLAKYDNRSTESIDLGVCASEKCIYKIQRIDLVDYELFFYKESIIYARITDGVIAIYPWDNPHIFIAIAVAITIALIYAASQTQKDQRYRRKRVRKAKP